ncbi:BMP family protein [Labrys wisconsinensis]|uniref:Basic membrane protein A n=1 Tax=Labrys wisconsinensis TaxID=425677 RepID=A0ABU0J3R5_9HYPH|nr:BMP family protein [Labrys wisconsinensis]MDQ0468181.1 basic membrane protein A [Labrys wisconsinensis]
MSMSRRNLLQAALAAAAFGGLGARTAFAAVAKVALVLPGSIADGGWNQGAYEGLKALEAKGFKTAFTENVAQAAIPQVVRGYADDGYDLIVGHGFQFGSLFAEIAPDYPSQKFFATTTAPGGTKVPDNALYLDSRFAQVAYAAGALAALMSVKKGVGVVGGGDNPTQQAMVKAFKAGAVATVPGLQAAGIITGDYNDAAKGREAADTLIGNGADVIWHIADLTGIGAIQGAAAKTGVKIIGSNADQMALAPEAIGTSFAANNAGIVEAVAGMVADGSFKGGGAWAPPVDFLWLTVAGSGAYNAKVIDEKTWAAFQAIWKDLKDGKIDVAAALK